jgi:hypothetical protein
MKFWLHTSVMVKPDDAETKIANIPPFGLRMRSGLKTRLEEAAKANGRSLNSEIVARLEQSFREKGHGVSSPSSADQEKRLTALEEEIMSLMIGQEKTTDRLEALEKRLNVRST